MQKHTGIFKSVAEKRVGDLKIARCKGIPETADNLERVYRVVDINSVRFTMIGDYKLLMPTFGLMSCSSTHP